MSTNYYLTNIDIIKLMIHLSKYKSKTSKLYRKSFSNICRFVQTKLKKEYPTATLEVDYILSLEYLESVCGDIYIDCESLIGLYNIGVWLKWNHIVTPRI
jgi:hypothetical protein